MQTYVIGDIHGMSDLLDAALDAISADAKDTPRTIVFLGDYVDRGADSRAVLARLRQGPSHPDETWMPLRGNHDQVLIDSVRKIGDAAGTWMANGGWATLQQYMVGKDIDEEALNADADLLDGFPLLYEDDHRFYVHAGLNPARPLVEQTADDMLWIRDEFLRSGHDFGKLVVHGHTITDDQRICICDHRVGLDTGAFEDDGALSVAIFDQDQRAPLACLRILRPHPGADIKVERDDYRPRLDRTPYRHPADVMRRR